MLRTSALHAPQIRPPWACIRKVIDGGSNVENRRQLNRQPHQCQGAGNQSVFENVSDTAAGDARIPAFVAGHHIDIAFQSLHRRRRPVLSVDKRPERSELNPVLGIVSEQEHGLMVDQRVQQLRLQHARRIGGLNQAGKRQDHRAMLIVNLRDQLADGDRAAQPTGDSGRVQN
jgi:hypothetical protein